MPSWPSRLVCCIVLALAATGADAAPALDAADTAPLQACFAPGTPDAYVEEVTEKLGLGTAWLGRLGRQTKYRLATRWSATASDGPGLVQGDPTTLTWSYVPDGTTIPGFAGEPTSASNLQAWLTGVYGDFDTWHALFQRVFDRWAEITGNTYVFEPSDDGASFGGAAGALGVRGDVRIGAHLVDGNAGILAYNFYPNTGDMVLDSADGFLANTSNDSLILRNVLAHEHGHGLGIAHVCPINGTKLMEPFLATGFDGPQHDDMLAGQRGYGDANEDDDAAGAATPLGGAFPPGVTVGSVSIDDDADPDFYAFDGLGADAVNGGHVVATVAPNGFTYPEGPQSSSPCGPASPFDSASVHDLALEVLDTDGTTSLGFVDDLPAGSSESLTVPIGEGTYFIRVLPGPTNDVQLYDLDVEVQAVPVASAGGPYSAECQGSTTALALDASASADPDGGTVAFSWTSSCPGASFDDASSPVAVLSVTPPADTCDVACEVTVEVVDEEGQADQATQSVSIVDSLPPSITCPDDIVLVTDPGDCSVAHDVGAATASDVCDQSPEVGNDSPGVFPRGSTLVTHVAMDECGAQAACGQLVSVVARMACFSADCSKLTFGTGAGDGKVAMQGGLAPCDGADAFGQLAGADRVRVLVDGFVVFDQPWSAFEGSDLRWKYAVGSVSMTVRGSRWKLTDRASDLTAGDVDNSDGVAHELWLGANYGDETLLMDERRGDLQACRHGQDRVSCD